MGLIGVVAANELVYRRLCIKLGLLPKDTVYFHGNPNHIGLYLDRLIFTCGWANYKSDYLEFVELRLVPGKHTEFIACCDKMAARF